MFNILENNAYRILGLNSNSNQKDIMKRYKEIVNRLKIEDYPEYDFDINLPNKMRDESSVADALKRLQSSKTCIKEYFFWFSINNKIDNKALKCIQERDFAGAIDVWKNAVKSNNVSSYIYKKNLALLYCLSLFNKSNNSYLKESISIWHELLTSDKFWTIIIKKYSSDADQTTSPDIILDFKKNSSKYVSDIYTELHEKYKENEYIKYFQEVFGVHGEITEKNVLQPIYEAIYGLLEDLKKFEISENKNISEEEIEKVNNTITEIQKNLRKLEDMGVYKTDQSKVVRDNVAEAIRLTSVLIHNNTIFLDESSKLLKIAVKICGTESLKNKFEEDLKQVKKNEEGMLILEIPGFFSNKKVIFYNNFVEYKDKKMLYPNIEWVSYQATSTSVNGIPTGTTYKFKLTSKDGDEIDLSPKQEVWNQLISLSKQIIEPIIIKRIVNDVFEKNDLWEIGGITISKKGYSKNRLFGGTEEVLWGDRIFVPQYLAGNVVLFKEENGKAKQFIKIPMSEGNSVLLPELIHACADYFHFYGDLKKDKQKIKREYEFVCDSCNKVFNSAKECKEHEKNCKKKKFFEMLRLKKDK